MVTERFEELIAYVASCNGTGRKELDQKVAAGVLSEDDAVLVFYYASIRQINDKLDIICKKAKVLS